MVLMKSLVCWHRMFADLVWKTRFCSIFLWFLFGILIEFLWLIAWFVPVRLGIGVLFVHNVWTHLRLCSWTWSDYSQSLAFLLLIVYMSLIRKSCVTLQIAGMLGLNHLLSCLILSLFCNPCLFWKIINLINS